jgi:hypothetical protein
LLDYEVIQPREFFCRLRGEEAKIVASSHPRLFASR